MKTTKNGHSDLLDSKGKFKKGNKGGPGRPALAAHNKLRKMILEAVDKDGVERLQKVVDALYEKAEKGYDKQARLLFEYGIGKPRPHDDELDAQKNKRWTFDFLERGYIERQHQRESAN